MLVEEVKRNGLDYGMFERLQEAWTWWREWVPAPARVRIVADDDSDGVTSAHCVSTALQRAGYEVDLKIMPVHSPSDVDDAFAETRDAYVVLDCGSAVIDTIDAAGFPTLILDHHRVRDVTVQNTFEVNPRRLGGDKVEHVSTSILAALFAVTVGDHWDVSFAGVAGAISDRQHLGGWRGLTKYVADGAVQNGILSPSPGFTLVGATMEEAIVESLDPFFEHYTGKPEAVRALLARHNIAPTESPVLITGEKGMRLAKELTDGLRARGVVTDRMYPLYDERYLLRHTSGVSTVFGVSQLLEAATAAHQHELALKTLRGDVAAAKQIRALHKKRLEGLLREIERLRSNVHEMRHLRWAETKDGSNTGVYAHTLLSFVHGDDKPFVIVSNQGDLSKLSSRGSPRLYRAGIDLSIGMGRAAEKVGGHGGGHPGASGATIPSARRDEFLRHLDEVLGQLARGGAP